MQLLIILYLPQRYANRRNFRVLEEIGVEEHMVTSDFTSKNTTVMSDFRQEVEIWPFHACVIKICNITVI